jgi:DNA repair exonuclease SbcCD nuclease subunit
MEKQKIKIKKIIPVSYVGSIIQQNFGENVSNHGYLLWNVETKNFTEHNVRNDYSYYNFKIKSLDDLDENKEILTNL